LFLGSWWSWFIKLVLQEFPVLLKESVRYCLITDRGTALCSKEFEQAMKPLCHTFCRLHIMRNLQDSLKVKLTPGEQSLFYAVANSTCVLEFEVNLEQLDRMVSARCEIEYGRVRLKTIYFILLCFLDPWVF
jgi:hypothetical protein